MCQKQNHPPSSEFQEDSESFFRFKNFLKLRPVKIFLGFDPKTRI